MEELYKAGRVLYLESALEISNIAAENEMALDSFKFQLFFEEGDNASGNGLMDKIIRGIQLILQKIRMMGERCMYVIKNIGKSRLTAEEYMNSETGAAEYHRRCGEIAKEIDDAFLEARPLINAISNATNMNPALVEKICDGLNKRIEKSNWEELFKRAVTKQAYAKKLHNGTYKRDMDDITNRIQKATNDIKSAKTEIKDKEKKLRALNKSASVMGKFSSKLFGWAPKKK